MAIAAAASVPIATTLLARELDLVPAGTRVRDGVALLSGLLVAITPQLWQSAAVLMSDTAALALATFGAWAVVRYAASGDLRWALLAAAGIGAAIVTRWMYAVVAVPLMVTGLVTAWRAGVSLGRPSITIRHVLVSSIVGLLVLAPAIGPMTVALARGESVPFSVEFGAHPWDPANAFRSTFATRDGLAAFPQSMLTYYLLEPARTYYLTPFFAILALVGLFALARRRSTARLAVLVGWPALVLVLLVGDRYQNTRFALAMLPPIAILAALGSSTVLAGLWRLRPPIGRWATIAALVVSGLAIVSILGTAVAFTDGFIERHQTETAAIRELAAEVPLDARLVTFGATATVRRDGLQDALELYDQDPAALPRLVGDGRATYLLIPTDALDTQWSGSRPGLALEALRDGPGLTLIDSAGSYQLYRIGGSPAVVGTAYRTE